MAKTYKDTHSFMVAHVIDDAVTGQTFERLPRHVTLHPWFETFEVSAMDRFLKAVRIIERRPIDTTPHMLKDIVWFGPGGDKRARTLGPRVTSLGYMHGVLAACFDEFDGTDTTYTGGAYTPHETEALGIDYDNPELRIVVNSMCLIRRDEKFKTVVAAEKLNQATAE